MTLPYTQQLFNEDCLSQAERDIFSGYNGRKREVRGQLRAWKDDGTLPILTLPERRDDLAAVEKLADEIRAHAGGLVVLGTGGSSLGGQTLCQLGDDFPVYFLDNLDPLSMDDFLRTHDLSRLHIMIISKSGATLETVTQALVFVEALKSKLGADGPAKQCHILSVPGDTPLRQLAAQYHIPTIDHDPNVGGRYSVLSNVGLLPAAVKGVDIGAVRAGAQALMDAVLAHDDAPPLVGAAWQAAAMPARPISVLMPYADRLKLFSAWYKQLWAESLGKGGVGSTPHTALGAVDQHSQLQLYLGGPKDKLITLITLPHAGTGTVIGDGESIGHAYLKGKTTGDVFAALQHGTIETMKHQQVPLRLLALEVLDARTLGALLMHYMIETIATAQLLGIDAFDQPAVEEGKQIARDTLRAGVV